jgi:hypothetical protein
MQQQQPRTYGCGKAMQARRLRKGSESWPTVLVLCRKSISQEQFEYARWEER